MCRKHWAEYYKTYNGIKVHINVFILFAQRKFKSSIAICIKFLFCKQIICISHLIYDIILIFYMIKLITFSVQWKKIF